MKIRIVTVGGIRTPHFDAACREYQKRLGAYASVEFQAVKAEPLRSSMSAAEEERVRKTEGDRLLGQAGEGEQLFALDERGKQFSSQGIARALNELMIIGRSNWLFVVGGPLGLSPDVRRRADMVWSLSKLTLPHELVPVILL